MTLITEIWRLNRDILLISKNPYKYYLWVTNKYLNVRNIKNIPSSQYFPVQESKYEVNTEILTTAMNKS